MRTLVDGFDFTVTSTSTRVHVDTWHGDANAEVVEHDLLPEKSWYISRVFVEADWRSRGVGTAMMGAVIDEIRRRGGKHILLEPYGYGSDPTRLKKFYSRLGFIPFLRGEATFLSKTTLLFVLGVPAKRSLVFGVRRENERAKEFPPLREVVYRGRPKRTSKTKARSSRHP
jgi:predicted GNAT family acetyltransferase